jgi:hypothetical protein
MTLFPPLLSVIGTARWGLVGYLLPKLHGVFAAKITELSQEIFNQYNNSCVQMLTARPTLSGKVPDLPTLLT